MKNRLFKTIALTLVAAMVLPMCAAFAHHRGGPPPRPPRPHHDYYPNDYWNHHRHHHDDGHRYHKDRVIGALVIGGIIGAVIASNAKDKERDGVNDRSAK